MRTVQALSTFLNRYCCALQYTSGTERITLLYLSIRLRKTVRIFCILKATYVSCCWTVLLKLENQWNTVSTFCSTSWKEILHQSILKGPKQKLIDEIGGVAVFMAVFSFPSTLNFRTPILQNIQQVLSVFCYNLIKKNLSSSRLVSFSIIVM